VRVGVDASNLPLWTEQPRDSRDLGRRITEVAEAGHYTDTGRQPLAARNWHLDFGNHVSRALAPDRTGSKTVACNGHDMAGLGGGRANQGQNGQTLAFRTLVRGDLAFQACAFGSGSCSQRSAVSRAEGLSMTGATGAWIAALNLAAVAASWLPADQPASGGRSITWQICHLDLLWIPMSALPTAMQEAIGQWSVGDNRCHQVSQVHVCGQVLYNWSVLARACPETNLYELSHSCCVCVVKMLFWVCFVGQT
jgi:hypothetical protein